ncbi:S41 family peptidase [Aneurinibacillus sp. BA2021]|nr:S41 family peptidase [Aneurinibacillus sp. BA2021]
MKKRVKQWLAAGLLLTSIAGVPLPAQAESAGSGAEKYPYAEQEARIHEVMKKVLEEHLNDRLDIRQLTDGAIRGLLDETGDPYTTYFTEKEFEEFYNELEGTFAGIGIYIQLLDDKLVIDSVNEGSAAEKAGLRSGDEIVSIDGKQVAGQPAEQAAELMKGEPGSRITLTIKRGGQEHNISVRREIMQYSPVDSMMLDNKIGYIALYTFSENSAEVFEKHLNKLKRDGMKGLILDLRDNGGGYLDASIAVADLFIDKGVIVNVKNRSGKQTEVNAKPGRIDVPLAVLVNEYTASASEVLAGALHDHKTGTLIGAKTFGKGVVQELVPLEKGGILKLTVEEYFSPKMHKINGQGIVPDITVEDGDAQLMKAISYLHGSTALHLYPNGTSGVAGFSAGKTIAKKVGDKWFIALRPFAGLYGYQIYWDDARQQAVLHSGDTLRRYSVKNNTYVRNEKGVLWVALDKLDSDFPSIYVEQRGDTILVHVK